VATYNTPYKPLPDSGSLNKQTTKNNPKSPDYWGEIRVNLKDLTAIKTEDGLTIIKLSGWKREDKNGRTFLSLARTRRRCSSRITGPRVSYGRCALLIMALQFECRKVALKQDRTGFVLTLSLHPDEAPEELLRDYVGARYMCVLARIKDDESHTDYKNRVTIAGILCRSHVFQKFMEEIYSGKPLSEDETVEVLCGLCKIESRTELNGNDAAKKSFDSLLDEFEEWKKNGAAF
jgi:hypothetical protein